MPMQARSRRRKAFRRRQPDVQSSQRKRLAMAPPVQNPPVDRQFMRLVVGRKGKPKPSHEAQKSGRTAREAVGDFLIELTTFHLRRRVS